MHHDVNSGTAPLSVVDSCHVDGVAEHLPDVHVRRSVGADLVLLDSESWGDDGENTMLARTAARRASTLPRLTLGAARSNSTPTQSYSMDGSPDDVTA